MFNTLNRPTWLLATALLVACGGDKDAAVGDTSDTSESATPDACANETYIEYWDDTPGCDGGAEWNYYAETCGWTSDGIVNAWETGAPTPYQWNEEHLFPSVDFGGPDTDGSVDSYDVLELNLPAGVAIDDFTPDVNTVFSCGDQDSDSVTMTYAMRVYDLDGNEADCILFGHDVDAVIAGNVDEPNTVSGQDWLFSADCYVY